MKLFNTNPYRVLGIKANASAPEKQKVKNRISAYIKVGKVPVLDFDICPPLKQIERTQELINLKSNEILSDEDKVKHALFWFVSGGTVDDIALSNLTEAKDVDKALAIFEKGSQRFVISQRSLSSIINHSSLEIICYPQHKDKTRLKTAINRKLEIASSDRFLSFLLNILNPNNTTITSKVVKPEIVKTLKELLKELFRTRKEESLYLEFFSDQKEIITEIKEKNNEQLIQTIKKFVQNCEIKREQMMEYQTGKSLLDSIAKIGDDLLTKTEHLLKKVSRANGRSSMIVSNIYEEVFSEVNYCVVGASNKFQEAVGRMVEHDTSAGIGYIKTTGKYCYDDILKLTERAFNIIQPISTPSREQITSNLEALRSAQIDWRNLHERLTTTSPSEIDTGSGVGDALVWILENFGFWIISAIILLFVSLMGC